MLELYKTKSKVISYFDFRKIDLSEIIPKFEIDAKRLNRDITLVQKQNAKKQSVTVVEKDDFVTLSCRSDVPKFNKEKIVVRIGKGLLNKELEEKIIGQKCGQTAEITVDNQSVTVCILDIARNIVPSLTDENVKEWNIDNVKTVDELREYYTKIQKSAYIENVAEGMAREVQRLVNKKSIFELDEEEISTAKAEGRELLWTMLKSNGIDPDNSTEEEVKEITGMSLKEHINFIEGMFVESFKSNLISCELMKKNNVVFTEQDYENALVQQMKFMETDDEQQTRKTFTHSVFIKQSVSDYYFNLVEDYIKEYLKKE